MSAWMGDIEKQCNFCGTCFIPDDDEDHLWVFNNVIRCHDCYHEWASSARRIDPPFAPQPGRTTSEERADG